MAVDTSLSERKLTILKAIIQNYLETGEPVGSRTLSKYTDLNLSSATIRNEMADLEDLGYIFQPHTSAGRIPSDITLISHANGQGAVGDFDTGDGGILPVGVNSPVPPALPPPQRR